jgi:hypothetical protein
MLIKKDITYQRVAKSLLIWDIRVDTRGPERRQRAHRDMVAETSPTR